MTNIEMVIKLMKPDLNDYQLAKLKNVLETIYRSNRPALPNEELIQRFVQHKKLVGMKDTSLVSYIQELRVMSTWLDNKAYCDITTADIKEYFSKYTQEHQLQPSTLQTKLRAISSFYDFLVNEEYIERNPTHKIERIMVEKKIKKAFTEEEIERMRSVCESKRDRALFEFLYSTGCRISECLGVKIKDINFTEQELIVFGKGHKERVVYLSNTAIKYINEYLEERQASPDEPLFTTQARNVGMTTRAAQLILKDIGIKANVDNVHPHKFRRTMATHLMEKGMPIEQIKEVLGHSRIDTTMIYCNVNKEKVKANFKEFMN